MSEVERLKVALRGAQETLRDFAENWDCDEDAHKYGTTCRGCAAKKAKESIDASINDAKERGT